ncbi:MAG: phosphatidylglycerol lysyltransferase domain-containing protein [Candidatus Pedobacter colombiensis]|uniref:Phosphatidylglycerol lysyltransferase domain-containing protein n=1 Tax=Candidatus Pedobacter colombiensis TaxID=3121371 RepID=A0AAJ5W3M5_9SPHI|nr:phosphatidylglycerol lysyltransferase domain-containing protein [Pedobacter sp.]WEK17454.1 MAG: phosphatidylglycerol lysyltransferase domain-containing protein [Pedobacter sp.]
MNKAKLYISKLVYNKFFWQLFVAIFMIAMAIFFIRQEHIEVIKIKEELSRSHPFYIFLGIVLTGVYIAAQGVMYVHSFKALNKPLSLALATKLFLKRNLVSVFLPAGGFSSLVFFTKEIEDKGVTKSQIHLASTLFGFCSILSVVVVAIPVLAIALLFTKIGTTELLSFVFLLMLTAAFILLIYSVSIKGRAYRWLSRMRPSLSTVLDEMVNEEINRRQFWMTLLVSIGIEVIGIVHLYISMLALGFDASWPAAIIGYIVMVILLIASPFLRGLGAIEVSLTFVLQQFGFPILAAATITLLFRFFEFWIPLLIGIFSFITKKDNLVLRILPACIILVLGIVNIISAITPAIPTRLRMVKNLLPEDLIVTSNTLVLVFGLILVIISIFLLQGSKRAWYAALFLTVFSFFGHLIKAADYEEAVLAFIAGSALLYTRKSYRLKPHARLVSIDYMVLIYAILAVLAYGVLGFYFIDKRHFGIDFHFMQALKAVLQLFFLIDYHGMTPLTRFGERFQDSIYISGAAVILFVVFSMLRPYFSKPYNSTEDFDLARQLLGKFGSSALDYFKVYPDKFLFFNATKTAFISFKLTRHFAIVLEDPVGESETERIGMIASFEEFCGQNGFISAYYRVPEKSLHMYTTMGYKHIPIGEEAVLDLTTFTLDGGKMKTTRSAISRLTAEGYCLKVYQEPIKDGLLQKLEKVSDNWLDELNQKEVAFTQGVFDTCILKNQTIITVEDEEEKVYAFLNLIPDYAPGEATYDLIRKVADSPNGVLDMLLAKTFIYLKEEGYKSVNMGLAPLSGMEKVNITQKTIKYAYENFKMFGQFKGLRRYKEKFYPNWNKKYLIYSHNYHLLQVPSALRRVSEGN